MPFNELAARLGLDEDEFVELVRLFIQTCTSDAQKLLKAIEQENIEESVKSAHTIKGSSGNMGFTEIYEVAKNVEQNAREGNLEGAENAIRIIKEKIDDLVQVVDAG
jgi:histidine phosphotransfer protein HptB